MTKRPPVNQKQIDPVKLKAWCMVEKGIHDKDTDKAKGWREAMNAVISNWCERETNK